MHKINFPNSASFIVYRYQWFFFCYEARYRVPDVLNRVVIWDQGLQSSQGFDLELSWLKEQPKQARSTRNTTGAHPEHVEVPTCRYPHLRAESRTKSCTTPILSKEQTKVRRRY